METFDDIVFNEDLFADVDHRMLILYQLDDEGPSLYIHIPDIQFYTFLQSFNDIDRCQQTIADQNCKDFTLFSYSGNIERWLWNNNLIPKNLENIILFCPFEDDIEYLTDWTRTYTNRVRKVIYYKSLEKQILLEGIEYILNLIGFYQNNQNAIQLLNQIYLVMNRNLMRILQNTIQTN